MPTIPVKYLKRGAAAFFAFTLALGALAACGTSSNAASQAATAYNSSTYSMSTIVTQTAYGSNAQAAMKAVNIALADFENRFSMFTEGSEIDLINNAAGTSEGVAVSDETVAFLQKALALSAQGENGFALTLAPLTQAWGITTDTPRVVPQAEIAALLPLVNDAAVIIEGNTVILPQADMGIDLGGIAKGETCSLAASIYEEYGVESALLWIGGNTYARGTKPDGTAWRIGFRNPYEGGDAYLASFTLTDNTIAVSDGTERFFEQDGKTYIHILDPRTGSPAESDILSVGAINPDGGAADFWSTTLFVLGLERTLQLMQEGHTAIVLDYNHNFYVSESLRDSFVLYENLDEEYSVTFIAGG